MEIGAAVLVAAPITKVTQVLFTVCLSYCIRLHTTYLHPLSTSGFVHCGFVGVCVYEIQQRNYVVMIVFDLI